MRNCAAFNLLVFVLICYSAYLRFTTEYRVRLLNQFNDIETLSRMQKFFSFLRKTDLSLSQFDGIDSVYDFLPLF